MRCFVSLNVTERGSWDILMLSSCMDKPLKLQASLRFAQIRLFEYSQIGRPASRI